MQHMTPQPSDHIRQFQDSQCREWRVFERKKPVVGDRPVKILVFESESSFRVVRTFPDEWYQLDPEDLEDLSRRV